MATKKKSRGLDTTEARVSRFLKQWEKNEHSDDAIRITFTATHGYLLTVTDLREILSRLKSLQDTTVLETATLEGPVSKKMVPEASMQSVVKVLSSAQRKVLKALGPDGNLYCGLNHSYWINGRRVCTRSTLEVLLREGLLDVTSNGVLRGYHATDLGKAVIKYLQ